MHPFVSIVVPVYNVAPYIEQLLEQLTHLSLLVDGLEFVFVEDCSTDNSLEVLERCLAKANLPNAKLIKHTTNRGVSATRNSALDASSGDYVWFIDSDDLISVRHAAECLEGLREDPVDCLLFDFMRFRESTTPTIRIGAYGPELAPPRPHVVSHVSRSLPPNETLSNRSAFLATYLLDCVYHAWAKIIRRSLMKKVRFPEGMIYEDQAVSPQLMLCAGSVRYDPIPIVLYRARPGSIETRRTLTAAADVGRAMFQCLPAYEAERANLTTEERTAFGVCLLRAIYWKFDRLEHMHALSNADARKALVSSIAEFRRFIGSQERDAVRLMPDRDREVLERLLVFPSWYLWRRAHGELWQKATAKTRKEARSKLRRAERLVRRLPQRIRAAIWRYSPQVKPALKRFLPSSVFLGIERAWRKHIYKVTD